MQLCSYCWLFRKLISCSLSIPVGSIALFLPNPGLCLGYGSQSSARPCKAFVIIRRRCCFLRAHGVPLILSASLTETTLLHDSEQPLRSQVRKLLQEFCDTDFEHHDNCPNAFWVVSYFLTKNANHTLIFKRKYHLCPLYIWFLLKKECCLNTEYVCVSLPVTLVSNCLLFRFLLKKSRCHFAMFNCRSREVLWSQNKIMFLGTDYHLCPLSGICLLLLFLL